MKKKIYFAIAGLLFLFLFSSIPNSNIYADIKIPSIGDIFGNITDIFWDKDKNQPKTQEQIKGEMKKIADDQAKVGAAAQEKKNTEGNDEWWTSAGKWFAKDKDQITNGLPNEAKEVIATFGNMINLVGTVVIVLVTIVLGIKYMFGSVEGKADVKESLITLLVACVFFFGWQGIWSLLVVNNELIFAKTTDPSYTTVIARMYSTAVYILQFLAIAAIIFIGIRYIFAGAQGKADLKMKSGQFLIGIIMTFATISLLTFISGVINNVL